MGIENGTVPENQAEGVNNKSNNKFVAKIMSVVRLALAHSGDILKLTGAVIGVLGTILVANYESKMSALTLISEREQAESQLRSSMFSHLISYVAGPTKNNEEIDSHRERVLVELLALNFHEHFEFKPLMLHADKRLSQACNHDHDNIEIEKQAIHDRKSLRSIARRVGDRQVAALLKEKISEPVTLVVTFGDQEKKEKLSKKDFGDEALFKKLLYNDILDDIYTFERSLADQGLLEKKMLDTTDFNKSEIETTINVWQEKKEKLGEKDFGDESLFKKLLYNDILNDNIYTFERSLADQGLLKEKMLDTTDFNKSEIETTIKAWQIRTKSDITQLPDQLTVPLKPEQYVNLIDPDESRNFFFMKSSSPVLGVMVSEVDWENETVEVAFTLSSTADNASEFVSQSFTLTWYDFPLTDNTILPNGKRFALMLSDLDGNESDGTVELKVVWFPKDYFTARERPINHKEFRDTLGI
jgi:hypothetical protein